MSTLELLRATLNADSLLCLITVEHFSGSFYEVTIEWPMSEAPIIDFRLPKHVFATRSVLLLNYTELSHRQVFSVVVNERHFRNQYLIQSVSEQ